MNRAWKYLFLFFTLVIGTAAFAQTFHGTVSGVVVDSQGAVIVDAAVQLMNPATGLMLNAKSSKDGEFTFPELTVGIYRLTVSLGGFQTKKIDNINVEVSKVQNLKVELSVGAESTVIDVDSQRDSDRHDLQRACRRHRFQVGARDADERPQLYADDSLRTRCERTYELRQRLAHSEHQLPA